MLAELLEQDHRQKVRAERSRAASTWNGAGGWRDPLAVPAGELLAHRLDDLPLARDHLQRLGDVLAQLRQAVRAAARAGCRRRRRRRARAAGARGTACVDGRLRSKAATVVVLAAACSAASSSSLAAASSVLELQLQLIEKPRLALGARAVKLAPQLLDLQLQMRDQRLGC